MGNSLLSMPDSKVLVDMVIEKESTRVMVVEREGKQYLLRFMNGICYTFEDLDNCHNSPVCTCYKSENCQYALVSSKSENKILLKSNSVGYLIRQSKTLLKNSDDKEYWVKNLSSNKISATATSEHTRIFISDKIMGLVKESLLTIFKNLNISENFSGGFIKIAKTALEVVIISEDRVLKNKNCYYDFITLERIISGVTFSKLDYIKVNLDSLLNSKNVKGFYRNSEREDKIVLFIG